MENYLDTLAIKHGADKCSMHHNYTKNYWYYFKDLQNSKLKILEIGINRGASLRMWKEFFFNSKIYGIDIGAGCKQFEEERIQLFIGDQSDVKFLKNTMTEIEEVDIIIDDGSHVCKHQIESFNFLFPLLKSGGIYVIEDCSTSYWPEFGGGLKKTGTCIEYFKNLVDDVNINGYLHSRRTQISNPDILLQEKTSANIFEKTIRSIHFYCGMIFILRR